jgi:hypothetical protein
MSTRTIRRGWWAAAALWLSAAVTLGPAPATADEVSPADRRAARELFEEGVELVSAGDLPGAIEKFRASYARNPRSVVLFNIGALQQELGDKPGALATFRQYLEVGGEDVDAERREQVSALVRDLEREMTFLEIVVNEPGATVTIDSRPVGTTPLAAPVPVLAGVLEIRVRKDEFDEAVTMVPVAPGETTRIEVALVRTGDDDDDDDDDDVTVIGNGNGDDDGGEIVWWKEWWFWTAVGVVVVGASVTTGVLLAPDDSVDDGAATWSVFGR